MKELMFRAFDKVKKIWIPGAYGFHILGENMLIGGLFQDYKLEDLNNIELMQFTGLSDTNGKEIYEGDILNDKQDKKGDDGWYICGSIGFHPENAKVVEWDVDTWKLGSFHLSGELKYREVIGNIYENPELLQEAQ